MRHSAASGCMVSPKSATRKGIGGGSESKALCGGLGGRSVSRSAKERQTHGSNCDSTCLVRVALTCGGRGGLFFE